MTAEKLRELMKEELAANNYAESNGQFYAEIYTDYQDQLSADTIREILKSQTPREIFFERVLNAYQPSAWELEDAAEQSLLKNPVLAKAYEDDEDLFHDTFHDLFYVDYPTERFLNQEVDLNIVLDTGDCNYDFTLNSFAHNYYGTRLDHILNEHFEPAAGERGAFEALYKIGNAADVTKAERNQLKAELIENNALEDFGIVDPNSALLWLCQQQGVSKTELELALLSGECYPKYISDIIANRNGILKNLRAYGFVPGNPMDHRHQDGALKSLLRAEEHVRKTKESIQICQQHLKECDLSYEEFCQRWLDLGQNRNQGRTPPSPEQWDARRNYIRGELQDALERANTELTKDEKRLNDILKYPNVAYVARLRDQIADINEVYARLIRTDEFKKGRFLETVIQESENTTSHMNALTALVRMPLRDAIELNSVIRSEESLNNSYDADERTGKSSILLDKDTFLGLYDPWNGAGGTFEIELIKPLKLPVRLIHDANIDGSLGYGIETIYGGLDYGTSLQEIREAPPVLPQIPLQHRLDTAQDTAAAEHDKLSSKGFEEYPDR